MLVGENSTGKSTFLGCYSVLHQMLRDPFRIEEPDFNDPLFQMGSFDEIIRKQRGATTREMDFTLSLTFPSTGIDKRVSVEFMGDGNQPTTKSIQFQADRATIEIAVSDCGNTKIETPEGCFEVPLPLHYAMYILEDFLTEDNRLHRLFNGLEVPKSSVKYVKKFLNHWRNGNSEHYRNPLYPSASMLMRSIAPLRVKPKRTYDPVRETRTPEGDHVPMQLMRVNREKGKGTKWSSLHDDLVSFGANSGLFKDIKVKGHGKNLSDPFQIQVKANSSYYVNLMDVGYGVSQSLPILVDILNARNEVFTLQQPEVHLHPRSQAELASLLIESSKKANRFLIETHSNYIVDRVMISVRQGKIRSEDVSLLYFESQGNQGVQIHNLEVNHQGEILQAPPSYRRFFMEETDRLLGFEA